MRTVLGCLHPHAWRAAAGITVKFTAAILELALPSLLAHIIDVCVPAEDLPAIWRAGGLMLLLAFGAAFCNITANRMAARVSMEMTQTLRRDLYRRTQALSCGQMDRISLSSLVSRLTNDTYNVHLMFDKLQRGGIRAPMLVLGGLALTFFQAPLLALVQLAACGLTFLAIRRVTAQGVPHYIQAQEAADTVVRVLRENASGVRVVKALACQGRERERFDAANQAARRAEETAGRVMAAANPLTGFLLNAGLVLVVAAGAVLVNEGRLAAGQIVAFLSYFAIIQTATLGLAKLFVKLSKGAASAKRIEEILLAPEGQPVRPSAASGPDLGMEDVSFSYQGMEKDLDGISFSLNKGETLGVLGPTGAGKSTLIALLLRLYDAGEGVVWVGGRDAASLERRELQGRFGVVFQNEALLNATIYENIAFLRDISREEAIAAAKTAQLWDFLESLPEGLDSRVDIRGANLSGGQRQRLLIARALAGRPGILILDSADSALDYRTAANLRAALRRDHSGVTTVLVSERIASLRDADRILVLEDGVIAAQGRHEHLLKTCKRYRRMAELQTGGGQP